MTDLCQVTSCGKPATYHSFPANASHPDEGGMLTCDGHLSEGMSHLPGHPAPEHWRVFPLHEGSPPYCAVTCPTCHPTPTQVHIQRIEVQADDPDRLVFGLIGAFTKKVTGEMAIPTDLGSLAMHPMNERIAGMELGRVATVPVVCACGNPLCKEPPVYASPQMWTHLCGCVVDYSRKDEAHICYGMVPAIGEASPVVPSSIDRATGSALDEAAAQFGVARTPPLIDGLTPEQCRERWEVNRRAVEMFGGSHAGYNLTPAQIEAGKRLHLTTKAGR